jgi:hypothetical protein
MSRNLFILFLAIGLLALATGRGRADEVSLYDSKGDAVAYVDIDDDMTIYLWSGKPVGYLEKGSVWAMDGTNLGWFKSGAIRDHDGRVVGCVKDAITMVYNLEPIKGLKALKPLKGLQQLVPLQPLDQSTWSVTPLSLFLAGNPD